MQEFFLQNGPTEFLHCCQWEPSCQPIGVVQLVHGVAEHVARYDGFARFLADRGYLVVGEDHPGHGKSVPTGEPLGYLNGGWSGAVRGIHQLYAKTRAAHGSVPYFILGHSMGSFLMRTYLYTYHDALAGVILSGTGWQSPAVLAAGRAVCRLETMRRGERATSQLLESMAFGAYNRAFAPNRTAYDWISTDQEQVDRYVSDPFCGFSPSIQLYREMFYGMAQNQKRENLSRMKKTLPIFFLSGAIDPVGSMGKGVEATARAFRAAGMEDVTVKLYEGMRHEPLNEVDRQTVWGDILAWIERH